MSALQAGGGERRRRRAGTPRLFASCLLMARSCMALAAAPDWQRWTINRPLTAAAAATSFSLPPLPRFRHLMLDVTQLLPHSKKVRLLALLVDAGCRLSWQKPLMASLAAHSNAVPDSPRLASSTCRSTAPALISIPPFYYFAGRQAGHQVGAGRDQRGGRPQGGQCFFKACLQWHVCSCMVRSPPKPASLHISPMLCWFGHRCGMLA